MSLLSPEEAALMKHISAQDAIEVVAALSDAKVKINCVDENGMTPLESACYTGNYEICKLLIERGADVNSRKHVHGYTALMFAGLGGHLRIVNLLLESGAAVDHVNSVGRNASQMAAFVGQQDVVSIIANFVPKQDIEYFTKAHGTEKTPKLPAHLAEPLHAFVRQVNIHPVKIIFHLQSNPVLLKSAEKIIKVLELLAEREMKKDEPNETLSLKFHFLSFIINFITKHLESLPKDAGDEETNKSLEVLLKNLLRGRDEDAFPIMLEQLLRQSIREFPYRDCSLFIQLVKTLYSVQVGEEPSAISILLQTINGQKGFAEDVSVCNTCGEPHPEKKCSQCKKVQYCDQKCQKLHWFTHKKVCLLLKEMVAAEKAEKKSADKELAGGDLSAAKLAINENVSS